MGMFNGSPHQIETSAELSLQMDQRPYPGPPLLFHIRMTTLFLILWLTDFIMFLVAVENTLTHGVGGMVLFASEVRFKSLSQHIGLT